MAIPKIKATYSLDEGTVRLLERVAERWGVSKSEALRRAIRSAAATERVEIPAIEKLNQIQKEIALTSSVAAAWARQARSERRAASGSGR
jgi:hypothetical protein